jgi:hypothetical protein
MPTKKPDQPTEREGDERLVVNGRVQFEELNALPSDLQVVALVFNTKGRQLGEGKVDAEGKFSVAVKEKAPFDGEIVIGPAGDLKMASGSTLYKQA